MPLTPVTQLLLQWREGNKSALDELTPIVYRELRRIAAAHLRHEPPGHTLQPNGLVHEAYINLVRGDQPQWENRAHFFAMASYLMRQILVSHARARDAAKRGGLKVTLDEELLRPREPATDIL